MARSSLHGSPTPLGSIRADEACTSLRFALARAVIESDPATRALPNFAVEPRTFVLDQLVRELTAHLGYQVAK